MGRRPSLQSEDDELSLNANERLLPPSHHEQQKETNYRAPAQPSCKSRLKRILKQSSLALVISSLTIYAFFMGILVGIHWKNQVVDVVCLERISRPCLFADRRSGVR